MLVSIIIRTLNEAQYLEELILTLNQQKTSFDVEVIIVDSGSTDATLSIAQKYHCAIVNISRQEFSFGRSLNIGCEVANGQVLVFISGHCVPVDEYWLHNLCSPLFEGKADYSYGRQLGGERTYFSEKQIFAKYYPLESKIPQDGFFCNNANSAITKKAWRAYKFDESITGLEDMELSKRLVSDGGKVAYVAEAAVFHYHEEVWTQVKKRFEREAIALQKIMPQVHIRTRDLIKYICISVISDLKYAKNEKVHLKVYKNIVQYRFWQYWGSYKGNHEHRKLSQKEKEQYFYPTAVKEEIKDEQKRQAHHSFASYESK